MLSKQVPRKKMTRKKIMKRTTLKVLLMLILVSAVYAGVNGSVEDMDPSETGKKKALEPAGKFVPTEKLRADDAIAFPVDI
jgi:hypothetical protein